MKSRSRRVSRIRQYQDLHETQHLEKKLACYKSEPVEFLEPDVPPVPAVLAQPPNISSDVVVIVWIEDHMRMHDMKLVRTGLMRECAHSPSDTLCLLKLSSHSR